MYTHRRHFCPHTIPPHTIHCSNTGQLGSLKVQFLKAFWNEVSPAVCPAHFHACKACVQVSSLCQQPPFLFSSSWARGRKGRALTPSLEDFIFHWPLPFNQTRAARFKKANVKTDGEVSTHLKWRQEKCETGEIFIYSTVKSNPAGHSPTDMDSSHCS